MIFYSFEINNKNKFQSLRQIPKTVNIYDFSESINLWALFDV